MVAQERLRYEELGLPPAVGTLSMTGGKVFHRSYMGLHVYDASLDRWRHLGAESQVLLSQPWVLHANGLVVSASAAGTAEFDIREEVVTFHDGVFFDFRYSDTIVGRIKPTSRQDTSTIECTWLSWPNMSVIRTDSIRCKGSLVFGAAIPCSDSSVITLAGTGIGIFSFSESPKFIPITSGITSDRHYVYIDEQRTHIVLTSARDLMYSVNKFESYSFIGGIPVDSVHNVLCTADTNVVYGVHSGLIQRIHLAESTRDTLRRGLPKIFRNVVVVNDTLFIGVVDSVLIHSENQERNVSAGLPSRSCDRLMALSDGVVAGTYRNVLLHPSFGQWRMADLITPNPNSIGFVPMGGNDLGDFWAVEQDLVIHVGPNGGVLKYDFGFPGYLLRGVYSKANQTWFTMLYALEEACGGNQVVWASGNSPIRTLLCEEGIRTLMVFNNRDHVALTREGFGWRTVDGNFDQWEKVVCPVIPTTAVMRSFQKGNHGVCLAPGHMLWTHDAGVTWNYAEGEVFRSALAADGSIYTVRVGETADSALIVERRQSGQISVVGVVPQTPYVHATNELREVAFDDNERRLYIATKHFTGSIDFSTSSVRQEIGSELADTAAIPHGYYDLLGRFVSQSEIQPPVPGLYLHVSPVGVRRVVVY